MCIQDDTQQELQQSQHEGPTNVLATACCKFCSTQTRCVHMQTYQSLDTVPGFCWVMLCDYNRWGLQETWRDAHAPECNSEPHAGEPYAQSALNVLPSDVHTITSSSCVLSFHA